MDCNTLARVGASYDLAKPLRAVEQIEVRPGVIGGREVQKTVDGRSLHAFLQAGTDFKDWIARRIADYGFAEGADFGSFLGESIGGRPPKEYTLSLDMAKELAMVERTPKGKEARQYFIDCERRADEAGQQIELTRPSGSLEALLMQGERLNAVIREAIESRAEIARQKIKQQRLADNQARQDVVIQEVRSELADIRQYQQNVAAIIATPVPTKPGGCEAMTTLKSKFYKRHGLSGWVVDRVLTQLEGFRVVPKAYVQNGVRHEADGVTVVDSRGNTIDAPGYLVYQAATCTSVMNEFLRDCVRVSPCKVTHPALPGKPFNLNAGLAKGER